MDTSGKEEGIKEREKDGKYGGSIFNSCMKAEQ
jgi:hypothetical protein